MPPIIVLEYAFIPLGRTFHELSKHASESDAVDLSQVFYVRGNLSWEDIFTNWRTVILSEAGSGKTQEIRNAALSFREKGKHAFFLRLEHIPDDFEGAFEVGSFEEFEQWIASGEEGWLLLDFVDEARLRSPVDFEKAIRKLGRRISTAKDRTHIVLTGRTHAWRPKTDFALCEQHLGFTPVTQRVTLAADAAIGPSDASDASGDSEDLFDSDANNIETEQRVEPDATLKIVALDDLSRDQVKSFAAARRIKDTSEFLDAIERVDAWSFTSRPQDLEDLIEFWIDKGKIGSRLDIMRNSIDRRLLERDQNRADAKPLSPVRAREGARLIAATTTLSQNPTIQVPDGADNTKGISLRSVLPDWNESDQAALLSRPIFDEAIYGTVRFHHRSVREFLTAEWLSQLLSRPASRRTVENLLFRSQYGLEVIVPTMRSILPWLAILDDRIRERIRRIAPEVIFEGGDPSALPLETRQAILAKVCEKIANRASSDSATDYAAVQRFANPDLDEDIRDLLKQYSTNEAIVGFLLRMVWLGQLTTLLPEAKAIALSASTTKYTRISAFRAVRAVGTDADQEEIRQTVLSETGGLNRELLGELLANLKATANNTTWLLSALEKTEPKARYSVDRLVEAVTAYVESAEINLLPQIIAVLNQILDRPPVIEQGFCEVSDQFSWLMKPAAVAAERLIKSRHPDALKDDCLDILYKFRAVREWRDELQSLKVEFAELVPAWSELNRAALWHDVSKTRQRMSRKPGERLTNYWQASIFGAFWKFETDDFEYLCDLIISQSDLDDRLVTLSLAHAIYVENSRPRSWRDQLKKIVEYDAELATRLSAFLNPPPDANQYRDQERKWKRQASAREKRRNEQYEKSKKFIFEHIPELRDPKLNSPSDISKAQWYLHEEIREKNGSSNRWTDGSWRDLIPLYSEEVASAYRDGAVAYWRRYKPILRSEGAKPNTTPFRVIFGLTGLAIEANETTNWPLGLSELDVELACRYAFHELNGFPLWFPQLFSAYPDIIIASVLREIEYELTIDTGENETHYILSDISWSAEWAWDRLAPFLYDMLQGVEPQNVSTLQKLLKIIQGSNLDDAKLAALARQKVQTVTNQTHAAIWFAVWVGVEPDDATAVLSGHLTNLPDDRARTDFTITFITHLWGGRRSETFATRLKFLSARHLKNLFMLAHAHVRQEDDIERANSGVYSPGPRDEAQESRNKLFEELNKLPGKEAFLAVQEIATTHPQTNSRPWFLTLMRRKAQLDADMLPWTQRQVRDFHEKLDRTPADHRQLADLAVMRLLDLKDDLEEGDSSVAKILLTVEEETTMRNYIGHELREKAFGRYVIPQEEEMADAKKPDLRFHGVGGFDAPVPVELKLADNWTGPKMFERLEEQLAGDYLRDARSGRGVFVLVYRGAKSEWELPNSAVRVDFDGLLEALKKHWAEVSVKWPGVEEVTIIGIDLTKRFK